MLEEYDFLAWLCGAAEAEARAAAPAAPAGAPYAGSTVLDCKLLQGLLTQCVLPAHVFFITRDNKRVLPPGLAVRRGGGRGARGRAGRTCCCATKEGRVALIKAPCARARRMKMLSWACRGSAPPLAR